MVKVSIIGATAVLLGIGYAWAVDENQGTPPTTNPSSSGRPSAILSQNECQSLWNEALNKSATEVSGSASGQSSSGMNPAENPAETSKSVALEESRSAVDSNDTSAAASGTSNMGQTGDSKSPNLAHSDSGQGLSKQQATPYIANFAMVDKNSDGQISESEFQDGCNKGWVQAASASAGGQSGTSKGK